MADGGETEEKPFEPTSKKIEDARKKGNVPRSTDLNTTAAYAGIALSLFIWGEKMILGLGAAMSGFFSNHLWDSVTLVDGTTNARLSGYFLAISMSVLPLFVTPFALVLTSILAQRSMVFYGGNLELKLNRLSPIENAKKKFGRRGLFEFFKSFVKLLFFGGALVVYVLQHQSEILQASSLEVGPLLILLSKLTLGFIAVALLISIVVGALDYMFQRAEHTRNLRMTHKELMDEIKNSEGDPTMKQRRRQKGMEIARTQMLNDVKNADVVIVNPEHYAVVLKWDREPGTAPIVIAKGVDELAATIRRLARDHQVPIYSEPPTARLLYATIDIGQEIEPGQYRAVAAAIRFAESMRNKQRAKPYGSH